MESTNAVRLAPGVKLEMLHRTCPCCGFDLSKEFVDADADEQPAKAIEDFADDAGVARVSGRFESAVVDDLLQRMVSPLTEADKERAEGDKQCWLNGQRRKKTGSGEQEYRHAGSHKHFVPMVKRQLIKWIRHFRRQHGRSADCN